MNSSDKALMKVVLEPDARTLEAAANQLGIDRSDLDVDFGLVPIGGDDNLFTVLVRSDALPESTETATKPYSGPFSNPQIAPFGPPVSRKRR